MNDDKLNKILDNVSKMDFSTEESEKMVETLKELTETLESPERKANLESLTKGASLQVTDLSDLANKYLTDDAKKALSVRSKSLREVIDLATEKVTDIIYLGVEVRSDMLEEGVKVVSEQLNLLAAGGYIHSCLAPVSAVALIKQAGKYPTSVVIAYVHVPEDQLSLAKSLCENAISWDDNAKPLHSTKIDLPDGEFFAFERITVAADMIEIMDGMPPRPTDLVQHLANRYLAVLPYGTELVSAMRCGITDLSIPVELRFRSPIMDNVKEVKLDQVRAVGRNSGKLQQGNVIVGIQYLDKDGKDAYESARR